MIDPDGMNLRSGQGLLDLRPGGEAGVPLLEQPRQPLFGKAFLLVDKSNIGIGQLKHSKSASFLFGRQRNF